MAALPYQLSTVLGSVYGRGNLVFSPSGSLIYVPSGNRVSVWDVKQQKHMTLPVEARRDITRLCLSPDGVLLLVVDQDGAGFIVFLPKRFILCHINFKDKVRDAQFSPCGRFLAVTHKRLVQVWKTPAVRIQFSPMELYRVIGSMGADTVCLSWSADSTMLLVGSKDTSVRLLRMPSSATATENRISEEFSGGRASVAREEGTVDYDLSDLTLVGHKSTVMLVRFCGPLGDCAASILTCSRDGTVFKWARKADIAYPGPEKEQMALRRRGAYDIVSKFYSNQHFPASAVHLSAAGNVLAMGFENGSIALYDVEGGGAALQVLSLTQESKSVHERTAPVSTIAFHPAGDWVAIGSSALQQLWVYEWQTETFILRQRGHSYGMAFMSKDGHGAVAGTMSCCAYSLDGQFLATGGTDGSVKIWNLSSGFCVVTFGGPSKAGSMARDEADPADSARSLSHSPITGLAFSPSRAVFAASLDGVIRAYDLNRYRLFRTFSAADGGATFEKKQSSVQEAMQWSAVAVDASGELLCAAGQNASSTTFSVYVWEVKTRRVVDVLSGHSGPISAVAFSPSGNQVASCAWDKTLRLWSLFAGSDRQLQTLDHSSELLSLSFRPDGKHIAVGGMDGNISIWHAELAELVATIDCRRDLRGGRLADMRFGADRNFDSQSVRCLAYAADGTMLAAGGRSRFLCVYDAESGDDSSTRAIGRLLGGLGGASASPVSLPAWFEPSSGMGRNTLLAKFVLSRNRNIEGTVDKLNSKTDIWLQSGSLYAGDLEVDADVADLNETSHLMSPQQSQLPHARRLVIESRSLAWNPTNRSFCCATLEGALLFSLDDWTMFAPVYLDLELTPQSVREVARTGLSAKAVVMALVLNEKPLLAEVLSFVPVKDIDVVAQSVPTTLLRPLLDFLSSRLESDTHLEWCLRWITSLYAAHANVLGSLSGIQPALRSVLRGISRTQKDLSEISDGNMFSLEYAIAQRRLRAVQKRRKLDSETTM